MYCVYVIECKTPNHYYIGETKELKKRIRRHMLGKGARFTKVHGCRRIINTKHVSTESEAKKWEKELTDLYIKKYGLENVAGADKTQVIKGKLLNSTISPP